MCASRPAIRNIFQSISAKAGKEPCCDWVSCFSGSLTSLGLGLWVSVDLVVWSIKLCVHGCMRFQSQAAEENVSAFPASNTGQADREEGWSVFFTLPDLVLCEFTSGRCSRASASSTAQAGV